MAPRFGRDWHGAVSLLCSIYFAHNSSFSVSILNTVFDLSGPIWEAPQCATGTLSLLPFTGPAFASTDKGGNIA